MTTLLVGIGGALGSILRYWAAAWRSRRPAARRGARFPVGTLLVNVVGAWRSAAWHSSPSERETLGPRRGPS